MFQPELTPAESKRIIGEASKKRSGRMAYEWVGESIREQLQEHQWIFDCFHAACEILLDAHERHLIDARTLDLLAKGKADIGRIFHVIVRSDEDESDVIEEAPALAPPFGSYDRGVYVGYILRCAEAAHPRNPLVSFLHRCSIAAESVRPSRFPRKKAHELVGLDPFSWWMPWIGFDNTRGDDEGDASKAAVTYEWELLAEPSFVKDMEDLLVLTRATVTGDWTYDRRENSLRDDHDAPITVSVPALSSICDKWCLRKISTSEATSKPVFADPNRRIQFTVECLRVRVLVSGTEAFIPRYYSWTALRTLAGRDFLPLREAMESFPKMDLSKRTQHSKYEYARRIRAEAVALGQNDDEATNTAKVMAGLTAGQFEDWLRPAGSESAAKHIKRPTRPRRRARSQ